MEQQPSTVNNGQSVEAGEQSTVNTQLVAEERVATHGIAQAIAERFTGFLNRRRAYKEANLRSRTLKEGIDNFGENIGTPEHSRQIRGKSALLNPMGVWYENKIHRMAKKSRKLTNKIRANAVTKPVKVGNYISVEDAFISKREASRTDAVIEEIEQQFGVEALIEAEVARLKVEKGIPDDENLSEKELGEIKTRIRSEKIEEYFNGEAGATLTENEKEWFREGYGVPTLRSKQKEAEKRARSKERGHSTTDDDYDEEDEPTKKKPEKAPPAEDPVKKAERKAHEAKVQAARDLGIFAEEHEDTLLTEVGDEDKRRAGQRKRELRDELDGKTTLTDEEIKTKERLEKENKLPTDDWSEIRRQVRMDIAVRHLDKLKSDGAISDYYTDTVDKLFDALDAAHIIKTEKELREKLSKRLRDKKRGRK